MSLHSLQAPDAVIMIRARHFCPNGETARDNSFQTVPVAGTEEYLATRAYAELTEAVAKLREAGVKVHLFEDERADRPDAVFPNNWFSTHPGGHVAVYPMYSPSRRAERRIDVLELLKRHYRVQDIIDYSGLEQDNLFLEGTGAMVLDHVERVAYAARSNRTSEVLLERFCTHFNYEPIVFDATDGQGRSIYHTNVLMCIGTDVALIGLSTIQDAARRLDVLTRLSRNGREVVDLTQQQLCEFAGNAIELQGRDGRFLAMSTRALRALDADTRVRIEARLPILPLDIPTIEMAGGSVRCTIAGIHLSPRTTTDGDLL